MSVNATLFPESTNRVTDHLYLPSTHKCFIVIVEPKDNVFKTPIVSQDLQERYFEKCIKRCCYNWRNLKISVCR